MEFVVQLHIRRATSVKFWDDTIVTAEGCWLPPSVPNPKGYVYITPDGRKGKKLRLHRYIYYLLVGNIPPDKLVLHNCHNRWCFNPDHLRLGTAMDNTEEMMDNCRGRNQFKSGYSYNLAHPYSKSWARRRD